MAYKLTLTAGERAAFDFVGGRYSTGNDVSSLLCGCLKEDEEWDQEGDITFDIPEHVAWQIIDLSREEDHLWPLFDYELRDKMMELCQSII